VDLEGAVDALHGMGGGRMSSRFGGRFVVPHEGHRPECGEGPTGPEGLPVRADEALLHFVS